jgi:hypothetical protein
MNRRKWQLNVSGEQSERLYIPSQGTGECEFVRFCGEF